MLLLAEIEMPGNRGIFAAALLNSDGNSRELLVLIAIFLNKKASALSVDAF
jgi:hypothetical protein